jgi:hypothetical protein
VRDQLDHAHVQEREAYKQTAEYREKQAQRKKVRVGS